MFIATINKYIQIFCEIYTLKGVGSNRKRQKIKLMALQWYWQMELYFFFFFCKSVV